MTAAASVATFGRMFTLGDGVSCDLDVLVHSKLLVQANSGGGKSWALRRILEQTHGKIQQLVIDPEGEFSTLRAKFDYVLAARQGGDTLADPRTAKLLAERLLELNVSAVLDIYELKAHERVRFVRLFCEALVDARKELWHPTLVILDEAHVYAPQVGDAESAGAVKDLATRGRKRGFCLIAATQRLSKLHKDVAAECNNKLIGRTGLDVDMERAGDELGMSKASRQELRHLDAGEFFAFGPALSRTVARVHVGGVQTEHPRVGGKLLSVTPAPSEKVKAILGKLADLPAEAEAREKGIAELKAENANLKRQLTLAQKAQPEPKVERVEVPVVTEATLSELRSTVAPLVALLGDIGKAVASAPGPFVYRVAATVRPTATPAAPRIARVSSGPSVALPPGEKATLIAAAQYPDGVSREQASILTGYKRSSRDAYIARLSQRGYVSVEGQLVRATDDGIAALGSDYEPLPSGDALRDYWLERLPPGEKAVLECAIGVWPNTVSRESIDESTGYKRSSRDAYIARLGARKLVVSSGRGAIKASDVLFEG